MNVPGAVALREGFASKRLLTVGGAHNGLTARLVAEAGFDGVWASSFEISAAYGLPDINLLGMSENLAAATNMCQAVQVPVVADCETGFGGSLNAALTMMRFETSGVAAICFEDKVFPKRNSLIELGQQLLDADEFARKIEAAQQARSDSATVLIARTESFICGQDLNEALRRCHLYVDAGADAVLVHSRIREPTEVTSFLESWKQRAPVVVVPTTYFQWSAQEAEAAGVAMVVYANQGLRATVRAVRETWSAILAHGRSSIVEHKIASAQEVLEMLGVDEWLERGQ